MTSLYRDSIRRWYDNNYYDLRKGHPTVEEFKNQYWPRISQYFNKEIDVLDAGSGNGRFANFFGPIVNTVTAIDPWIPMNEKFKAENIYSYQVGVMEFELPKYMNRKLYDIVFMNGVLYLFNQKNPHRTDKTSTNLKKGAQNDALRKVKSLLSNSGLLILIGARDRIVEGYHDDPTTPLPDLIEIAPEYAGRYDISKICRDHGFKVVGSYSHREHNTHLTILQDIGDKE